MGKEFFFFFISCRECYPLKQVSGSCLRELCEFCLPLITLTQAKPLVRKLGALFSYQKHVHVSSVIEVYVHVICCVILLNKFIHSFYLLSYSTQ